MIPAGMTHDHVVKAMDEVDRDGVPRRREIRKFEVRYRGREGHYPPKLLVSYACRYATGRDLAPAEFNGGTETNRFLERLGFTVDRIGSR